jgi:hypothetical protein
LFLIFFDVITLLITSTLTVGFELQVKRIPLSGAAQFVSCVGPFEEKNK